MTWQPLALASTKETQAELERLLGLNRRTFAASAYLAQGDAGNFSEASPADRKAILSDALDPRGFWPTVAKQASVERLVAERALEFDAAKIAELEAVTAGLADLIEDVANLRSDALDRNVDMAVAETGLEQAQAALAANAVAAEKWRAAKQAERTAQEWRDRCELDRREALREAELLEPARVELAELEQQAARIPELERLEEEQRRTHLEAERAAREKSEADTNVRAQTQTCERLHRELEARRAEFNRVAEELRVYQSDQEAPHCARCDQILGQQARQTAMQRCRDEMSDLDDARAQTHREARAAEEQLVILQGVAEALRVPETQSPVDYRAQLLAARAAAERRAGVAERIRQLEEKAHLYPQLEGVAVTAERELTRRAAESLQAAAKMKDEQTLTLAVDQARAAQTRARVALDEANAQVTRGEEQLARVKDAVISLSALKMKQAEALNQLALLRLAERAFGRDGIPTLIVENTLAQIEANANGYLQMMPTSDGTVLRVQLETQRAQKTVDTLKETLDVLVSDMESARAYETFSGGERARVDIALRLALAILLADRRGAESRVLIIDELEGLDAEGQQQLVQVVRSVATRFDCVLIASHYGGIRDAFDQVLTVTKTDGVSRIAA